MSGLDVAYATMGIAGGVSLGVRFGWGAIVAWYGAIVLVKITAQALDLEPRDGRP